MTEKILEIISITREIIKNILMGNTLFRSFRNKIAPGRTTGSLGTNAAFHHCTAIVDQYTQGLLDAGFAVDYFENKNILEIGPGANLSVQLSFMLKGASRAYALDRFPEVRSTHKEAEIYEKIINYFFAENKTKPDTVYRTENKLPVFIGEKIQYFDNCSLEEAGNLFSREFDVIVSHWALECIADLYRGVNSISKIIKPGGICIFICNLKSIGVFNHENKPLRVLNYSDKLWNWMFSNRGGAKRVRAYGYQKLLEMHDFKILSFVVLDRMHPVELNKAKSFFNEQFKKLTDSELSILEFRIVAQYQGQCI